MSTQDKYDFIIIGAGCAGLSLAYRLIDKKFKVCILESSSDIYKKNKLWSFWDIYKTPFNHLIQKKWNYLLIKNCSDTVKINCNNYKYQSINSHDFNNYILKKIKKNKNINIEYSSKVEKISQRNKIVYVKTDKKELKCNHVFDSRPENKKIYMTQQFFGAYIRSDNEIFDDNYPILMEFSNTKNNFHFMYFLHFSKKTALIESTYFSSNKESKNLDENYINKYMENNYKNEGFVIEKKEFGMIPMDVNINGESYNYITKIGSNSGVTRASTGYTFINIQKQCDGLIKKILKNDKNIRTRKNFHSLLLRKMDSVYLNIVKDDPAYMKSALIKLFKTKHHNAQIRFLSDIPSILDIIKIIFYLPKKKFLLYAIGIKEKND